MSRKARRRRKLGITLAGGETAPQRATGRDRRHTNQPDGPPPIMQARARRCPIDIASVLHESDMGRCILALTTGEERAACADTWAALSAARENFRARILGKSPHPQAANLAMLPEPMQTDQSLRIDLRTPDERDAAAIRAWQEWQTRINGLPAPQYRWAINGALNGFISGETLWRDGSYTQSGANAVSAIKLLTNPQDRVG